MKANQPWLYTDAIAVLGAQHPFPKHPENIFPKFDPDNDFSPEDHINQFMLSIRLMDVQHEDVLAGYSHRLLWAKHQYGFLVLPQG
jgi:hypothetical protein